jgi:uridylate kinase
MDSTTASLCINTNIPIIVFGIEDPMNIIRVVRGEEIGTKLRG